MIKRTGGWSVPSETGGQDVLNTIWLIYECFDSGRLFESIFTHGACHRCV